jgi:voltage-gated potassium channel
LASTIIYFLERSAQPEHFGSILASAWWALETLTTVGYGDVTPMTPLGKMFGGIVMLFGLCMFALPVAIIATGFNQEAARHEFMVTWSMVARVPLFSTLDAPRWPKLPSCSTPARSSQAALIVSPGEPGGAMYLIGSGEATVCVVPRTPHQAERGRLLRRDGADRASPPQA